MKLRLLVVAAFSFAVLVVPTGVTQADPPAQCTAGPAGRGDGTLAADVQTQFNYDVPEGVSSVSGAATVHGYPSWGLNLINFTSGAVSSPTISIATGLDPSVFNGELPAGGSCGLPSLAAGQGMHLHGFSTLWGDPLAARGVQDNFTLGYDSSISGPTVIPVGGGDATETFTVTITDPRLVADDSVGISVFALSNGAVQVVSRSDPTNLDQGETVVQDPFAGNGWTLLHPQLDKPYVFTALVHVDNPGDNGPCGCVGPLLSQPFGDVMVGTESGPVAPPGSSVTVPDPSVDGSFTFSVAAPGSIGAVSHEIGYRTNYPFVHGERAGSITSTLSAGVPAGVDNLTSGSALPGTWSWNFGLFAADFGLSDFASWTVPTPSISVASGYAPSQLEPNGGSPASSLPIVFTGPTVTFTQPTKQPALGAFLGSTIAGTLRPGCDTSRSVSPLAVPVGGGEQTITFTVSCSDPSVREVDLTEQVPVPGATLVSATGPADGWAPDVPSDASAGFGFGDGIQTGTTYTFTAVVQVPNPHGQPFLDQPLVEVTEDLPRDDGCFVCGGPLPQTSVRFPVPSLDGPTPGAGIVTFSTGDPKEWQIGATDQNQYTYGAAAGPFTSDQCKQGGWQAFGVFENQGDCVSYVATKGKNLPG